MKQQITPRNTLEHSELLKTSFVVLWNCGGRWQMARCVILSQRWLLPILWQKIFSCFVTSEIECFLWSAVHAFDAARFSSWIVDTTFTPVVRFINSNIAFLTLFYAPNDYIVQNLVGALNQIWICVCIQTTTSPPQSLTKSSIFPPNNFSTSTPMISIALYRQVNWLMPYIEQNNWDSSLLPEAIIFSLHHEQLKWSHYRTTISWQIELHTIQIWMDDCFGNTPTFSSLVWLSSFILHPLFSRQHPTLESEHLPVVHFSTFASCNFTFFLWTTILKSTTIVRQEDWAILP